LRADGSAAAVVAAADVPLEPPVVPAGEPPLDDAATLFEPPVADPDAPPAEPDGASDGGDSGTPPDGPGQER
jgi:hypothetical protein